MRVAILTVSDAASRGDREDASGPALSAAVERLFGLTPERNDVLPDERSSISERLRQFCEEGIDLVLTTGGTGLSPRDRTPEAVRDVIELEAPGLAERMRAVTGERFPAAFLSRQVAGIAGKTLIVALPGSPSGAVECLESISELLPHAVALASGARTPHPRR